MFSYFDVTIRTSCPLDNPGLQGLNDGEINNFERLRIVIYIAFRYPDGMCFQVHFAYHVRLTLMKHDSAFVCLAKRLAPVHCFQQPAMAHYPEC